MGILENGITGFGFVSKEEIKEEKKGCACKDKIELIKKELANFEFIMRCDLDDEHCLDRHYNAELVKEAMYNDNTLREIAYGVADVMVCLAEINKIVKE